MGKFNSYSALAANAFAADDLYVIRDTSVTTTKSTRADVMVEGLLRVSAGVAQYDGTTITLTATNVAVVGTQRITTAAAQGFAVGRQGITDPALNVTCNVATCVTGINIIARAAAAGVDIVATSSGTNESVKFDAKGTGTITLNGTATGNVIIGPNLQVGSAKSIVDANGNEIIKTAATVASAVNEVTVTNAATTTAPSITATGGDTNISLTLAGKGTGVVQHTTPVTVKRTVTAKTDSATLTIAEVLTGVITADPTITGQTYTLPTAALLVAGIANCKVGDSFSFLVNNLDATHAVTIAAGSGGTGDGTLTVAAGVVRRFTIYVTNVTGAAEAYFVLGEGA